MTAMLQGNKTLILQPGPSRRIPPAFLEQIIAQDCLWGLRHPEGGWALCTSSVHGDRDVYLFWSERRLAWRSIQQEWAEFEPVPIGLHDFMLSWLDDMVVSGTLIGLDWDPCTEGTEYDTAVFKRRLAYRLNRQKKII
jgi:hypothetical protein